MRHPATLAAALLVLTAGYALWPTTRPTTHPAPARTPAAEPLRPAALPFPARTADTTRPAESLPLTTADATLPFDAAAANAAACRDEARALADRLPSEVNEVEISDLAGRWARLNPAAAFAWAAGLSDERLHNFALGPVLEVWTLVQPREAITAIVQSELPETKRDDRLLQAIATWSKNEPGGGQKWLAALPNDGRKTSLLIATVDHTDGDRATSWLTDAAPPRLETASFGKMLVNALSLQDPRSTADTTLAQARRTGDYTFAIESLIAWAWQDAPSAAAYASKTASFDEQKALIPALIRQWSAQDAVSASEWAARLPEGRIKELALGRSVQTWAQTDPVAAANFLLRYSPAPTPSRDAAASRLAISLADIDLQAAYEWARSIHSPARRETALTSVLTTWLATDETAALPYLRAAGLSEMARQEALFHAGELRHAAQTPSTPPR